MRNKRKNSFRNLGSVPTQFLTFQLLIALEYHTWYHIDVKIQFFYQMIRYANDLIIIFINISNK